MKTQVSGEQPKKVPNIHLLGRLENNERFLALADVQKANYQDFYKPKENNNIRFWFPWWSEQKKDEGDHLQDVRYHKSSYLKRLKGDNNFIIPIRGEEDVKELLSDAKLIRRHFHDSEVVVMFTSESDLTDDVINSLSSKGLKYVGNLNKNKDITKNIELNFTLLNQKKLRNLPDLKAIQTQIAKPIKELTILKEERQQQAETIRAEEYEALRQQEKELENQLEEEREKYFAVDSSWGAANKFLETDEYKKIVEPLRGIYDELRQIRQERHSAIEEIARPLRKFQALNEAIEEFNIKKESLTPIDAHKLYWKVSKADRYFNEFIEQPLSDKIKNKIGEIFSIIKNLIKETKVFSTFLLGLSEKGNKLEKDLDPVQSDLKSKFSMTMFKEKVFMDKVKKGALKEKFAKELPKHKDSESDKNAASPDLDSTIDSSKEISTDLEHNVNSDVKPFR